MELVIIRGLPGSGKSTYAKKHFPHHKHYEADMYFCRGGEYEFNPAKLNAAHRWCQDSVKKALLKDRDVVVSNTFIHDWEFDPYLTMMGDFGASLRVIELRTQFGSIHNVPEEKMKSMAARWKTKREIQDWIGTDYYTYEVVK